MAKSSVKRVIIEVPEGLRVPPGELEERLRIELALRLYEKGIASLGQARRIAGLSKWDFLELLTKEKTDALWRRRVEGRLGGRQETCGESDKAIILEIWVLIVISNSSSSVIIAPAWTSPFLFTVRLSKPKHKSMISI